MKTKKSPKADLERKRGLFLEIGFILALGICLVAFEWPSEEYVHRDLGRPSIAPEIELLIINPIPPPPPPPEVIKDEMPIYLKPVDNETETDDVDYRNSEDDWVDPTIKVEEDEIDIPVEITEPIPICNIKDKPLFPGGEVEMLKFINKACVYPEISKTNDIDGTVYVQFVIDRYGQVKNASVLRGVDKYLDAEALRIINSFPRWQPGKLGGSPVPVTIILPIKFTLE
ncbi:MAG: energy transducer TonB [Marinilabiliales bacterium]|nr:MAG: energy transducer TonB [Marinilabiliales bacterium]